MSLHATEQGAATTTLIRALNNATTVTMITVVLPEKTPHSTTLATVNIMERKTNTNDNSRYK